MHNQPRGAGVVGRFIVSCTSSPCNLRIRNTKTLVSRASCVVLAKKLILRSNEREYPRTMFFKLYM